MRRTKEDRRQRGFKLMLVLTPFVLVLVLGMIEWWAARAESVGRAVTFPPLGRPGNWTLPERRRCARATVRVARFLL